MTVIGIDLGTTNSACGVWTDEGVKLIPNRLGDFLTPSVVGYDDSGKISVGRIAKERLISHSDKTVAVFKRLMGTDHKIEIGSGSYTATELSSLVLRSLKEDAETYLGEPVSRAVISVPAYFNDNQRLATKLAGELAGLKVERLINEPTAAAIAYGLHEKNEGTFLILDMGGGTFDVSILEFFDGVMEVHASAGDNYLGGEDFVDAMLNNILSSENIRKETLSRLQLQTMYMKLESAKRQMDARAENELSFELGDKIVNWKVTEEWFTKVAMPLMLRAKRPIETAIRDARLSPSQINDIVLVGGATRMKLFRSAVAKLFGRFPSCNLDPDLVVTMGAAIQAGLIEKHKGLDEVVLTDVCPYTLGTEVNGPEGAGGGFFLPIIERNTVVPVSIVRSVQTAHDNQTEVAINVYQGEHRRVEKNVFLGSLTAAVPKGPAGQEVIDIRYSYDMNGLLEVDVKVVSTGKKLNKVIEHAAGAMDDATRAASLKKLSALKFHPRDQEENRMLLSRGERIYETSLGEERDYIAHVLAEFDAILERQNQLEIKKARQQLEEVLKKFDNEEWF
ncbi:MAG: molecular chaperone HscC [Gammaproteobacteria bacterium]|nr:molecular chaperone HscC [Gammaproteobacteria bacterium]MDH5653809.1 molecular chaperone HscC [Gammaproteobacteria bacterium]